MKKGLINLEITEKIDWSYITIIPDFECDKHNLEHNLMSILDDCYGINKKKTFFEAYNEEEIQDVIYKSVSHKKNLLQILYRCDFFLNQVRQYFNVSDVIRVQDKLVKKYDKKEFEEKISNLLTDQSTNQNSKGKVDYEILNENLKNLETQKQYQEKLEQQEQLAAEKEKLMQFIEAKKKIMGIDGNLHNSETGNDMQGKLQCIRDLVNFDMKKTINDQDGLSLINEIQRITDKTEESDDNSDIGSVKNKDFDYRESCFKNKIPDCQVSSMKKSVESIIRSSVGSGTEIYHESSIGKCKSRISERNHGEEFQNCQVVSQAKKIEAIQKETENVVQNNKPTINVGKRYFAGANVINPANCSSHYITNIAQHRLQYKRKSIGSDNTHSLFPEQKNLSKNYCHPGFPKNGFSSYNNPNHQSNLIIGSNPNRNHNKLIKRLDARQDEFSKMEAILERNLLTDRSCLSTVQTKRKTQKLPNQRYYNRDEYGNLTAIKGFKESIVINPNTNSIQCPNCRQVINIQKEGFMDFNKSQETLVQIEPLKAYEPKYRNCSINNGYGIKNDPTKHKIRERSYDKLEKIKKQSLIKDSWYWKCSDVYKNGSKTERLTRDEFSHEDLAIDKRMASSFEKYMSLTNGRALKFSNAQLNDSDDQGSIDQKIDLQEKSINIGPETQTNLNSRNFIEEEKRPKNLQSSYNRIRKHNLEHELNFGNDIIQTRMRMHSVEHPTVHLATIANKNKFPTGLNNNIRSIKNKQKQGSTYQSGQFSNLNNKSFDGNTNTKQKPKNNGEDLGGSKNFADGDVVSVSTAIQKKLVRDIIVNTPRAGVKALSEKNYIQILNKSLEKSRGFIRGVVFGKKDQMDSLNGHVG